VAARKELPAVFHPPDHDGRMDPAKGRRVELGDAYVRYAAVCRAKSRRAVTPEQFADAMGTFCEIAKIKTRMIGGRP
jgi:hypothetical protein